jgi:ABC-type branched-subunit amino acid transport system substrate-binding protein
MKMQVESIVNSAITSFGIRRFAILYPDEPYGRRFKEFFLKSASTHNVKVNKVVAYKPRQTDFAKEIKSMVRYTENIEEQTVKSRDSNRHKEQDLHIDFEALFIPDSAKMISMIAPQLDYYDVNGILLLGTNLWHSKELIELAGDYVQEAVIPEIFFENSAKDNVKGFVSKFHSQFGYSPGFMEAVAYDSAVMALQTLLDPRLKTREDVKIALRQVLAFDGITGVTSFDQDGDSNKKLFLLQIIGDQFIEIEESENIYSNLKN